MKKISAILLVGLTLLMLCSCQKGKSGNSIEKPKNIGYINGVWISYIEIDNMIKNGGFEENFSEAVEKCKALKITDIFLHTVPFCDTYYTSKIYPMRSADILSSAVSIAHKNGIRIHAWINPYRVKSTDNTISGIKETSPVYKWANENSNNVLYTANGVYLNPTEAEVRKTVIDVIREICTEYKVDGIHFDDYFYPTTDVEFDEKSYQSYVQSNENPLTLNEYRTASVNSLISGCYTAIKYIDKDILFSISPAADIAKNLNNYYADIETWCKNGCVDIIIPQIYFGFNYPVEKFRFDNLLCEWKTLVENTETRLCIGLAPYKIGTAKQPDCDEWQGTDDIVPRQTEICIRDSEVSGHVFYSYTSLFNSKDLNSRSLNMLQSILDSLL